MPAPELVPSRYREIVARIDEDMIFEHGFTDSSMRSHILPTLRWNIPTLCIFAAPAPMEWGVPRRPDLPDRWVAFEAYTGALRLFAFTEMLAFTSEPLPPPDESDPAVPLDLDEARRLVQETKDLLGLLTPMFVTGANPASGADSRRRLLELLRPSLLYQWERLMAPDFYDWLEKG